MYRLWRIWRAIQKRFVAGVMLFVLVCGARVAWDAARLWVFGAPATIPLDSGGARAAADSAVKVALDAQPLVLDGAAPLEQQIPYELRHAIRPEIESWILAWRVPLGNFRLDQLGRTAVRPLDANAFQEFDGNAQGQDLRLLYLCLPGMDPLKLADPYLDLDLTQQGDRVIARRIGSPGVAIIDLARRTRQRALTAPPFGRFDGAHWIDATRLLVLASERIEANPFGGGPVLYIIDLKAATVTRYAGPSAAYEDFKAVRAALDRRLRAGNRSLVFASS